MAACLFAKVPDPEFAVQQCGFMAYHYTTVLRVQGVAQPTTW